MRVTLAVHTLHRLLEALNLGEAHTVFAGGQRYYSPRFKQEDDARFQRELAAAGIGAADGVSPDFVDTLELIQRAGVEYYGWFHDTEGPYSVLTAAIGRRAVLAERVGDNVTFENVDADRLVEAFVFRLPNVPAARGEAISVRLSDLDAKREGYSRQAGPPEARRLRELMAQPRVGGAKLYTARRDGRGRRVRADDWLTAIDLHHGRWAIYQTGRGDRSVSAVPGSTQFIAKRLRELNNSIDAAPGKSGH